MKPLRFSSPILSEPSGRDKKQTRESLAVEDAKSELSILIGEVVGEARRDKLLAMLEGGEFWRAPASSRKSLHGSFKGGLAIHTLLVVRHMRALVAGWECSLPDESVVVAGVVHDLAKGGVRGMPYYLGEAGKYSRNPELPAMGQAALSLFVANCAGFGLSAAEYSAVLAQDGFSSDEGRSVFDCGRKVGPLAYVMHFADAYVAGVVGV